MTTRVNTAKSKLVRIVAKRRELNTLYEVDLFAAFRKALSEVLRKAKYENMKANSTEFRSKSVLYTAAY